jgi:hypothetical protein
LNISFLSSKFVYHDNKPVSRVWHQIIVHVDFNLASHPGWTFSRLTLKRSKRHQRIDPNAKTSLTSSVRESRQTITKHQGQ